MLQRTMVNTKLQRLMGILRHLRAKLIVALSTLDCHFFKNFLAIRDRMSTMLSNVSLDHDEGMDVQEASTFRFSEEPSLEKM